MCRTQTHLFACQHARVVRLSTCLGHIARPVSTIQRNGFPPAPFVIACKGGCEASGLVIGHPTKCPACLKMTDALQAASVIAGAFNNSGGPGMRKR